MFKKAYLILMFFAVFFTVPTVYSQNNNTVEMITFTDDLGRDAVVPAEVSSVVTLAPSLTEIIYFLGGEDLIKGVDINSDFPESMKKMSKITSWDAGVNYEMLLALKPDIIFASEMTALDEISNLEKLGLTVYAVKNPADFPELFESILMIGTIIGKTEEAVDLVEELSDRTDAVKKTMEKCGEKELVFYELDATDPSKPWTAGKNTFISEIISLSNAENLGDMLEGTHACRIISYLSLRQFRVLLYRV